MDEEKQKLNRLASQGDSDAITRLANLRYRTGDLPSWCGLASPDQIERYTHPTPMHLLHLNAEAKEYITHFSAHGFAPGGRDITSPMEWTTLHQARAEAYYWSSIADTVGGDAVIIHGPTGQNIGRWY